MEPIGRLILRSPASVWFVAAEGGPAGAPAAFARLEVALGGPRGRRFFGWFFRDEYRACAVRMEGDDAAALGLLECVLPGGPYVRARHEGEIARIHETFVALGRGREIDPTRPDLEEYVRAGETYALRPVAS